MKTFICEICGHAHIGSDKPSHCPFCGAHINFLKAGFEANPITNRDINLSELSKVNLLEALALENNAVSLYKCMSSKGGNDEVQQMYKALAKIENEHAEVITLVLKKNKEEIPVKSCSDQMTDNFKLTIELEEHASDIYARFAKEAVESDIKILFAALSSVENDHIALINNYYKK